MTAIPGREDNASSADELRANEQADAGDLWALGHCLQVARDRLTLAREALVSTGYFSADEVGPDIAPRIIELYSALTQCRACSCANPDPARYKHADWCDVLIRCSGCGTPQSPDPDDCPVFPDGDHVFAPLDPMPFGEATP